MFFVFGFFFLHILTAGFFLFCFSTFFPQLRLFCIPGHTATNLISKYKLSDARPPTRNQFSQAAMGEKKKTRIRPVHWGEMEGQNVNFPGKAIPGGLNCKKKL